MDLILAPAFESQPALPVFPQEQLQLASIPSLDSSLALPSNAPTPVATAVPSLRQRSNAIASRGSRARQPVVSQFASSLPSTPAAAAVAVLPTTTASASAQQQQQQQQQQEEMSLEEAFETTTLVSGNGTAPSALNMVWPTTQSHFVLDDTIPAAAPPTPEPTTPDVKGKGKMQVTGGLSPPSPPSQPSPAPAPAAAPVVVDTANLGSAHAIDDNEGPITDNEALDSLNGLIDAVHIILRATHDAPTTRKEIDGWHVKSKMSFDESVQEYLDCGFQPKEDALYTIGYIWNMDALSETISGVTEEQKNDAMRMLNGKWFGRFQVDISQENILL